MPKKPDSHNSAATEARRRHHECTDPSVGSLATIAGLVVLLVAICLAATAAIMAAFSRQGTAQAGGSTTATIIAPNDEPLQRFPGPNLQRDPSLDLAALREREDKLLNTYGWIDREAGTVRLPIDRAMDLLVERGLPQTTNHPPPTATKSRLDLIRERSQKYHAE